MTARGAAALLLLLTACGSPAKPAPPPGPTPEEKARAADQKSRELLDEGNRLFNLGDFGGAIGKFEEGYKINPQPTFLYNLGQAHRMLRHCENAAHEFRTYLAEAKDIDPAQRTKVEGLIAEMEACPPPVQ